MKPLVYPPDWLFREIPPPLSDVGRRFLAEGDSWFTIGTLNLAAASNLLFKLEFGPSTAIVNCAYPGDTLQHMVDRVNDPWFDRLLRAPRHARFWEAILVSAGGNDLIDAAGLRPTRRDGSPRPLEDRLLLTPAEAAAANPGVAGPARFVSEPGWARLAAYLQANFAELVRRRDAGPSRGRPIILHTYAVPVVRPAGMPGAPEGWLYPALAACAIPGAERLGVVELLFERLRQLLLGLDQGAADGHGLPQVHVYDSAQQAGLEPAAPGSTGLSGDWINEIHPSPAGYARIGRGMGPWIDAVLAGYP